MKKFIMTLMAFALVGFLLTSFVQSTNQNKPKPKVVYKVGSAQVVVWENVKPDGTTWKNYEVEKVYKKGEDWESNNSFSAHELLQLNAALAKAISEEIAYTK